MNIGYARVSTQEQNLDMQTSELEKYGCTKIFEEKVSAIKQRPQLEKLINMLREGDKVVVWKLDRLGRSLSDLIKIVAGFKEKGVEFVSLQDNINTDTPQGRMMFNLFATFAEYEREIISERTKAGLARARALGRMPGRKAGLSKESKKKAYAAAFMKEKRDKSDKDIWEHLEISKATFYRYMKWIEEEKKSKILVSQKDKIVI
ncbi:MAG: hypothetical protein RL154_1161 [Pseudomonadota bacterium]|jgi:DNA invertase Pin-like site-specific DNA recombinase